MHKLFLIGLVSFLSALSSFTMATDNNVINKMLAFKENPNKYIFNYTDKPKELKINEHNIKGEAHDVAYKDKTSNLIRNNFDRRPEYKFNNSLLKESKTIIDNSDLLVNGISNAYVDCKKVQDCKTIFSDIKYCLALPSNKIYKCNQELLVNVKIPEKVTRRIRFELRVNSKLGGEFSYNLRSQTILSSTGGHVQVRQDKAISEITCNNFQSTLLESGLLANTFQHRVSQTVTLESNCNNPIIKVSISQGHPDSKSNNKKTRGIYAVIDVSSQDTPIITDSFINQCLEIDRRVKAGICVANGQVCVSGKETKVINGVEVTRDCWNFQTKYNCGHHNNEINECQQYEDKECLQVSSSCVDLIDGICTSFKKGYRCPLNKCSGKIAVSCGDGYKLTEMVNAYTKPAMIDDSNFANSASKLAVIAQAANDAKNQKTFSSTTPFIFKGRKLECRKTILNFKNCCKDNGWGVDMNLAECSSEEKELGMKKENLQAVYVSQREDKYGTSYKQYCVFDSKLARLIQEHGRKGQLGIGFGAKKHIDCRGLTSDELARINLDRIDLSVIFADVTARHKEIDIAKHEEKVSERVKKYYSDGVSNG